MTDQPGKEVLIEIVQVGNAVKVTAVDPESLVEVSITSPVRSEKPLIRTMYSVPATASNSRIDARSPSPGIPSSSHPISSVGRPELKL